MVIEQWICTLETNRTRGDKVWSCAEGREWRVPEVLSSSDFQEPQRLGSFDCLLSYLAHTGLKSGN